MKTKITFLAAMLLFTFQIYAQSPNWAWAHSAGGNQYDYANSVTSDAAGNVYVAGYFRSNSITFGTITLTNGSLGANKIFIVKYDALGNAIWAKSPQGQGVEAIAYSITFDHSGNIYVAGYFSSTITFGSTVLNSIGSHDLFLAKYDPSGNVLWAKSAGGRGTNYVIAYCVTTDPTGNVYLAGSFSSDTLTFGSTNLINAGGHLEDIFIAKYDASGNVVWAKSAGGVYPDRATTIKSDAAGNIFLSGYYGSPAITFGSTTLTNGNGGVDVFLVKYDGQGNVAWAKSAVVPSSNTSCIANSVTTDAGGNIYLAGYFANTSIRFDAVTLTSQFVGDATTFLFKFNTAGNAIWAKKGGGIGNAYATSSSTDAAGNTCLVGYFTCYHISFDSTSLTNQYYPNSDVLMAQYDANGNLDWSKSVGSTGNDQANSVSYDIHGNLYVVGFFDSPSITFGSNTLTNIALTDMFIAKLNSFTGINEINPYNNGIVVYPNPSNSVINIHLSSNTINEKLVIFDALGRDFYNETVSSLDNKIDVSKWNNGVYYYQINNGKEVVHGRFVLQK